MTNGLTRRDFLAGVGASAASLAIARSLEAAGPSEKRMNILLITADDMDYHSLGVTGCKLPNITPNLDALAKQGMLFNQAHVTIAVCQPCRSVLMTGRYPHRNGAMGFEPIDPEVPTLQQSLNKAGYFNGIMAKVSHLRPQECFMWDYVADANELGEGRHPDLYYKRAGEFFTQAKSAGKPFFLMANSQDPHRPFAGSAGEKNREGKRNTAFPEPIRTYKPAEVPVPDFLPDIPGVREEVAQYFSSVRRCDQTVGEILRALKDSGQEENTVVFFLSDNGISIPWAKTNCYLHSTRTPLIVRWPGNVKPGSKNDDDLVSGIDFMPTVLDIAGVKQVAGVDGRTYRPLLEGGEQDGRDKVFTQFWQTSARKDFPMVCVRTKRYSYIYNAWSDGTTQFQNEPMGGLAWKAMVAAAPTDKKIAERVDFFLHRVPEELYDLKSDPVEQKNLVSNPKYKERLIQMRAEMLKMMESTKHPVLDQFRKQVL